MSEPLWKRRVGRPSAFETPEDLWDACVAYFEWCAANPIKEEKLFAFQGEITRATVDRIRAMTQAGLCLHLGIGTSTWHDYKSNKGPEFSAVTTRVEQVMFEQKFTGAAADMLNANIIARDLGLADTKNHTGQIAILERDDHAL